MTLIMWMGLILILNLKVLKEKDWSLKKKEFYLQTALDLGL